MKIRCLCAVLFLALASTTFAGDRKRLIDVDPFCDYVGHWVELKWPLAVVERHSGWWGGHGVESKVKVDYGLIETNSARDMKIFGILPAGHKVFINNVRDETLGDYEGMMAYGRTTLPWNNKEVTFAYTWGDWWILHRAPWEPEDTPERRGPPGKLPPHFNYSMFQPAPGTPKWGLRGRTNTVPASPTPQPTPTNSLSTAPIIQENKVSDAPRIGDAPRVADSPR